MKIGNCQKWQNDALNEPEFGGFEGFEQQKPVDFVIIEDQLKRIAKWLEWIFGDSIEPEWPGVQTLQPSRASWGSTI